MFAFLQTNLFELVWTRAKYSPVSASLWLRLLATTIWSKALTPISFIAATNVFVNEISAWLGSVMPEGWLCVKLPLPAHAPYLHPCRQRWLLLRCDVKRVWLLLLGIRMTGRSCQWIILQKRWPDVYYQGIGQRRLRVGNDLSGSEGTQSRLQVR